MIETELPAGSVQPLLPDTEPGHAAGQIVSRVRLASVIVRGTDRVGSATGPAVTVAVAGQAPPASTAADRTAASRTAIRNRRRMLATSRRVRSQPSLDRRALAIYRRAIALRN